MSSNFTQTIMCIINANTSENIAKIQFVTSRIYWTYDLIIAIISNQHLIVVEDIDVTIKLNESSEKVLKQNFS